jgi:hypothetical protein
MIGMLAEMQDMPVEDRWREVRRVRNFLLARCDWTQLSDATLTEETKASWVTYRQALRDLPAGFSMPEEVDLPATPAL